MVIGHRPAWCYALAAGEWEAFVAAIKTGAESPIPLGDVVKTMLATFALEESRSAGKPVVIRELRRNVDALDTPEASGFDQAS